MKIYNKIIGSLLAPGMLLAMASCDDKNVNDGYQPQVPTGNIAYFPSNVSTTFEVSTDKDYVEIPVYRGTESGTLSVTLEVIPVDSPDLVGEAPFTYDTTVTFNKGEKIAYLKISYDIAQLEYNDEMQYELYIPEELHTPYGLNSEVVSIVYPEPWLELGAGYYYDAMFGDGVESYGVETYFYQNELDKTRFRIANPYYPINEEETYFEFQILQPGQDISGTTVTLENLVYFDVIDVTYIDSFEGVISLVWPGDLQGFESESDWTHNYVLSYQAPDKDGYALPGEIRLAPIYIALDSGYWAGDTSAEENVRIIFPGYIPMDLTLDVKYDGILVKDENADVLAEVTLGDDIELAKVAVAQGTNTNSIIAGVESGSIESVEVSASGSVKIPFYGTEEGKYTIVALGYNDGEVKNTVSTTFSYSGGGGGTKYNSLGYVNYTDAFICSIYPTYEFNGVVPYSVEIQENPEKPGYYRLVNPYGATYPLSNSMYYESDATTYLYIDATNPNRVTIPESWQTVMPDPSYGPIGCWCMALYFEEQGEDKEEIYQYGYYGTLKDGKITFNPRTLVVMDNDGMYYANFVALSDGSSLTNADGTEYAPFSVDLNQIASTRAAATFSTRGISNIKLHKNGSIFNQQGLKDSKYRKLKAQKNMPIMRVK